MRFRRSVGTLSGICVLSLTLGLINSTCEGTNGSSQSMTSAASGHSGMHTESPSDKEQQKPCKFSAVLCCQAMTSCGLSAQLARTVATQDVVPGSQTLPSASFRAVLSRITPPEPPPPKA